MFARPDKTTEVARDDPSQDSVSTLDDSGLVLRSCVAPCGGINVQIVPFHSIQIVLIISNWNEDLSSSAKSGVASGF